MKIYEDIEQGTEEWLQLRLLKFTASNASTILAQGKGLKTLIKKMLTDYYSSREFPEYTDDFKSFHMQRGNEFEHRARTIYELETGNEVKQVGFVELDEHTGMSPDGLVGDDGLIEIKNFSDGHFMELLITKKIETKYYNQMQYQMYVSGREWVDFFAFNPNFSTNFYLERVKRDPDAMVEIKNALKNAIQQLKIAKKNVDLIMKGE
jgi:predicted phage-related endonuclease